MDSTNYDYSDLYIRDMKARMASLENKIKWLEQHCVMINDIVDISEDIDDSISQIKRNQKIIRVKRLAKGNET